MKKIMFALFIALLTLANTACKVKEGCPTNNYTSKANTTKHGKSQLFPRDMRRKMGN
jgi:hypothetical protein